MIFMIVFEAFTNGTQGAVRFVIGLECLLCFLDANVAALQRSMRVLAGAGVLAVLLRFLLARAFRAFRAFREL